MRAGPHNLCLNLRGALACTAHRQSSLYEVYLKKHNAPAFAAKRRKDFCDSLRQDTNGGQCVVFILALSADSGHLLGALGRVSVTATRAIGTNAA